MKIRPTLLIFFLSFFVQAMTSNVYAKTTVNQLLARCAEIDNNQKRLACYDKLVHTELGRKGQVGTHQFIQPPKSFLDSMLVSEPWKAEYTLTVQSFVDLISHAVLEDKTPVTVQGWSREKEDYVLHIKMKSPVELHFLMRKSHGKTVSMSLLRDVKMDGYTLGADQFIMSIAAMVPDK